MEVEAETPELLRRDAQGRIPELDGLRGLAILLVLLWHYLALPLQPPAGHPLRLFKWSLALTWSGVDLFFVLSGFLIGGILLDQRGSPSYFSTFYVRRACRIFPLYYAWFLLYLVVVGLLPAVADTFGYLFRAGGAFPAWSYGVYAQNFYAASRSGFGPNWLSVTWSLAIEEQFYLLLPALVYVLRPRRLAALLLGLILLTPLIRWVLMTKVGMVSSYVLLPARWDALFLGVLVAWAIRQPAWEQWLIGHARLVVVALVLLLGGVVALTIAVPGIVSPLMCVAGYSIIALAYTALLVVVLLNRDGVLGRVMRARALRKLGQVSYGVYVFHVPVLGVCFVLLRRHAYRGAITPRIRDLDDALVVGLALFLTIVLSLVSFRWFERRLIALGHKKRYDPAPESPA